MLLIEGMETMLTFRQIHYISYKWRWWTQMLLKLIENVELK